MTGSPELNVFHELRAVTVEFGLRQGEFAARNGLHATDVRALIRLLDAERAGTDATAGWLGAQLGLNSAGTTAVIDRLERLGHLARVRDDRDRRRVLLRVQESAKELGRAAFGPLIEGTVALLREFDEREVEAVRRFLTGVREIMGAGAGASGEGDGDGGGKGSGPGIGGVPRTGDVPGGASPGTSGSGRTRG